MCNEKLKFGRLQDKARVLGAAYVATGHYARIEHGPTGSVLKRAVDERKDQSYFLFSLRPEQLSRSLTPLGGMTKPEVRAVAQKLGLKVYDKEDSQEICFVPGNDYAGFLKSHFGESTFHPGGIYDRQGRRLGEHAGIELYTVGQRKGLPGGQGKPLYVIDIDPVSQRVIVGDYDDLLREDCLIANTNWLPGSVDGPREVTVKIRYNWPPVPARLEILPGHRARLLFREPQRSVSPGQAAVCYVDDLVVGGGWIERSVVRDEAPIRVGVPAGSVI
jgi:tRNA-specific 2-thiouridylase